MHDVFPKARFRDCITMIEKVGHKSQIRTMRNEWINETKPDRLANRDGDLGDADGLEVLESIEREQAGLEQEGLIVWCYGWQVDDGRIPVQDTSLEPKSTDDEPLFVDDFSDYDMDEILKGSQMQETAKAVESEINKEPATEEPAKRSTWDDFQDEMEVMGEMGDMGDMYWLHKDFISNAGMLTSFHMHQLFDF